MKTVITTKWVRLQSATQCRLSYRKSEIKDDDLNGGSVKFKSFQRILPATSFVSNNPFKTKGLSLSKFYRGNEPELSSLHLSKRHAHSISPFDLGTVSQTIIKKFLRSKYINFSEDKGCIILQLPEHLLTGNEMKISWDEVEESVAPVYINKVTGTFIAPDSAIGGDWIGLQEFITAWMKWKQTKKSSMNDDFPVFKSIIPGKEDEIAGISEWNEATPVHEMDPVEFKAVLKTLRITVKALKQEDFAEFGARILQSTSEIENHSNVQLLFPVRYIDGCLIGFRRIFICPHDGSVKEESIINQQGSLNPNNCNIHPFPHGLDQAYRFKASSIILVPSILDSITLWTKSPPGKVFPVTLANGITSFAPDHLPFYKDFKIVFWFADTLASFEAIKAFSEKLGQDRCSTMSRDIPQPSLAIKSHNIKDIVPFISQNSKDCSHEFIKMFESLREDVYIEFLNADEVKGVEWKRFTHLNDLLSGFRRGELTVFSGRTGKGKTTFISEYSLDLCMQNVSTLWGSFEVKPTRLAKMQLKQFSGIHLEDNLDSFDKWANLFQKLPMYYLMFHGSQEVSLWTTRHTNQAAMKKIIQCLTLIS